MIPGSPWPDGDAPMEPADLFVMSAREDGFCVACLEPYSEGDDIVHDAQVDGWLHLECE